LPTISGSQEQLKKLSSEIDVLKTVRRRGDDGVSRAEGLENEVGPLKQ
jgi:hypothetical protein